MIALPLPSRQRDILPGIAVSGDELRTVLLRSGARLVARQGHGDLLEVRRHLVFVRGSQVLPSADLVDALRMAAITPARFLEMIGELRAQVATDHLV
jgi:hypothetical protein